MKNEEIFTHKQNAVVDNSGKQIAIVLPSNCICAKHGHGCFAAQQMNHESCETKKLKKSNAELKGPAACGRSRLSRRVRRTTAIG